MESDVPRYRGTDGARGQGELLRKLGPDLVLLQEVNLGSAEVLRQAAGRAPVTA